jgi:photosystem II stability/assembly factor-like uncharacterized protein
VRTGTILPTVRLRRPPDLDNGIVTSARSRRRFLAVGAVALAAAGGLVAVTRPSGPGTPVEVQAAGDSPPGDVGDLLPGPSSAPTEATAPGSSSTSSSTTGPATGPTTVTTGRPTATSGPTTTTTTGVCAPAAPVYAFGLWRQPDGDGWAAGANPALQRSTDGGRTWGPACLPASAVSGAGALHAVAFTYYGYHGWVVGGSGGRPVALRTVDGGDRWLAGRLPDGLAGSLTDAAFADFPHGWAVGHLTGTGPANATGGILLATSDGGATWTERPLPEGIGRLSRLATVGASHAWAVGMKLDGTPVVVATTDGGATWTAQTLPGGIRELRDVAFVDTRRGWAVGALPVPHPVEADRADPGVILTTADGGATWTEQATTVGSLWSVSAVDADTVFAGGGYGLFSTTDGGTTWAKQPFTLPALDAISFTDATSGWVTHSMFSTVCRTEDGGRTWVPTPLKSTVTPAPCTPVL